MREAPLTAVALEDEASAARPQHGGRKLRIGLFADSPLQPRWMVEAFAGVAALEFAEVVAIAAGEDELRPSQPWAWRTYFRLDSWLFGARPDPSERVDLRLRVPHARALGLPAADAGRPAEGVWRAKIAEFRLDVAFALGDVDDRVLEGVARYGVWRFFFGLGRGQPEALAGAREAADGSAITASGLTVRREAGEDRLVYQSWSRTIPFSVTLNRRQFLRKTGEFAGRALKELHCAGGAWLDGCPPLPRVAPARKQPLASAVGLARDLCALGGQLARRGVQRLVSVDQWFIAYRFGGERWQGDLREYTALVPPRDRFWADPFALERGGRHYIFFEEYLFAARKAHIAMVEVGRGGACSEPQRVLECGYHLSYPFLLEHDGELFMIPESGANRTVELYRCVGFPHRWRLEKVLLRGAGFVDATVHRAGDRWWMFTNVALEPGVADDELHVYYADSLFGEWQPHPANPVKSDARSARPAGRLFERDGALYRPAQICGPLYGSGVSINLVRRLSPEAYVEQEVERILPLNPARLLGIHTLNRDGELYVLDGFMRRGRVGGREVFVRASGAARASAAAPAATITFPRHDA